MRYEEDSSEVCTHLRMGLTPGMWILAEPDVQEGSAPESLICVIDSLTKVNGVWHAQVRSFNTATVMRRSNFGADMPYASASSLSAGGEIRTLVLITTAITILIAMEHRKRVRFIEQI